MWKICSPPNKVIDYDAIAKSKKQQQETREFEEKLKTNAIKELENKIESEKRNQLKMIHDMRELFSTRYF